MTTTLLEQFDHFMDEVGRTDEETQLGAQEADEWVTDKWDVDDFRETFRFMYRTAIATALAEGDVTRAPVNLMFTAFRFGLHVESQKHLPKL